jgi:hypothetical protein
MHTRLMDAGEYPFDHHTETLQAALGYARRGWHVFPLIPGDKRPAFPDHQADNCTGRDPRCARAARHVTWRERATTDTDRIRAAWTHRAYGIGIACGPSGLLVVDLDTPKPGRDLPEAWRLPGIVDGADVLATLTEQHGQAYPADTYTVHTPSGGAHLYFTAPDTHDPDEPDGDDHQGDEHREPGEDDENEPDGARLGNTAGSLGPMVDTRGAGGYVAAPPTRLAGAADAYRVGDPAAPVAALPGWLAVLLRPKPMPPQQPVTVTLTATSSAGDDRAARYVQAAVDRTLAAVLAAEPGTRNRALYGAAVSLGQLVAGGVLDHAETYAALVAAGTAVGQTERAATGTVRSGMTAGANRPRTITATSTGAAA